MARTSQVAPALAAGAQVVIRDEEWVVRSVARTPTDGREVTVVGASELVRGHEAIFLERLDPIVVADPERTELVADESPGYRRGRLFLEAVMRATPIPASEPALAVTDQHLLDRLEYQRRPAALALAQLRPRILLADAVGLGKTLEIGILLAELIRRGQGERILVVTPRHILEQFQQELWTRFAIPLVRLDSVGIERVRQRIPASRNPFGVYPRAIISIDTLKNPGRYRHHLEGTDWDAVVIDECHNLVNRGTLNNALARVLAPRTRALILSSATPHNGDPESFAELIGMLDPTAIADPDDIDRETIEHLYVRRHRGDVAAEVGTSWAERREPRPIAALATPAEEAVIAELATTWLHPVGGASPATGPGRGLFPWTLLKAFLSSHRALAQTVTERRKTIAPRAAAAAEDAALVRLEALVAAITDEESSKLAALVAQLREIGLGPRSDARAVVFSERIATLEWLAERVPAALGLKPDQVAVLHGGRAEADQQNIIEAFALADAPLRLLFTGDMASEGVNLHRQCHHLIHFDLPWSLIRIEQRNGRIDRYGQRHAPDIRALVLTPEHPQVSGEVRILARLLEREQKAHANLGDAASIMGLHDAELEEEAIKKMLRDGADLDAVVPEAPAKPFDLMALLAGGDGEGDVATVRAPALFATNEEFVEAAIGELVGAAAIDLRREDDAALISLTPPAELLRRLEVLPEDYLREQSIRDRLRLTFDRTTADKALRDARERTDSTWPRISLCGERHLVSEWLVDKVLSGQPRGTAPVLRAKVETPTYLLQGTFSNAAGQPQIVEWMAVTLGADGPAVGDLVPALSAAGVDSGLRNVGAALDPAKYAADVPVAVAAARERLAAVRAERTAAITERIGQLERRLADWRERAGRIAAERAGRGGRKRGPDIDRTAAQTESLIAALMPAEDPFVRLLAVLVPES